MNLKELRKKYDLRMKHVCRIVGMNEGNYGLVEKGKTLKDYRLENLLGFYKEYDKIYKMQQECLDKWALNVERKKYEIAKKKLKKSIDN